MVIREHKGPAGGLLVDIACNDCRVERMLRGTEARRALEREIHWCRKCISSHRSYEVSDEQKLKIAISTKIAMASPDVKARTLANQPDRTGTKNSFFGRIHSEESRRKISENNPYTGKCNPWWHPWMKEGRKRWGETIRRFFGNCCAMCSITRFELQKIHVKLDAHHVAPVNAHPELRYDFNNGVALCRPCHVKAHRLLKDDSQQYEVFMKELFKKRKEQPSCT